MPIQRAFTVRRRAGQDVEGENPLPGTVMQRRIAQLFDMPERSGASAPLPLDCDPRVRALYDYWRHRSSNGRPAARSDIDPVHIPPLLRYLFLIDVHPDRPAIADRFVYRLVGTAVVRLLEAETTGRPASAGQSDEEWSRFGSELDQCAFAVEPVHRRGSRLTALGSMLRTERLLLPLEVQGRGAAMILGMWLAFDWADEPLQPGTGVR